MNWKTMVSKMFLRRGYGIYKIGVERQYTLCPPYDYYTYSPWFEDWFSEIYAEIKDHTMVAEDRCYIIYRLYNH